MNKDVHKSDATVSKDEEQQAIEIMRESETDYEGELIHRGESAGCNYVLLNPDFRKLRCLERWYDSVDRLCTAIDGWNFRNVASLMAGNDGTEGDIEDKLRQEYGDVIDEETWIVGFIEGAVTKFNELKLKL